MPQLHRKMAIVVAAGSGERFGGSLPKAYLPFLGKPLLRYTAEKLALCEEIEAIQVVINPAHAAYYEQAMQDMGKLLPFAVGGATRQESVSAGLSALKSQKPDAVLIHDAARPGITQKLLTRLFSVLENGAQAAVPVVPIVDTLKRVANGTIADTIPREGLYQVQTPQAFRYTTICDLHQRASGMEFTDDAGLCEAFGVPVHTVQGEADNVKITYKEDWMRAEAGQGRMQIKVGTGFDVHAFTEGDHVMLCGVNVPHTHGLAGHSDADAGLHALTDAILGALGAGDIGEHFPPSDPRWKGVESQKFLRHAAELVRQQGGVINHLDVTLICEAPKITPYKAAMKHQLATILGLDERSVSVKATTTEQLGFTGRREGIAAQAVATLALPERH